MSKLLDGLRAVGDPARRKVALLPSCIEVNEHYSRGVSPSYITAIEYNIQLKLGANVYISDKIVASLNDDKLGTTAIQHAVDNVKRKLVEEVYSEFRKPMDELTEYILRGDMKGALIAVDQLRSQMFD